MIPIALYLLFVGALSAYRSSRHWPGGLGAIPWLGKPWWSWGGLASGTVLLVVDKGWTMGVLLSLCACMAFCSSMIFIANCGPRARPVTFILLHLACVLGLVLTY